VPLTHLTLTKSLVNNAAMSSLQWSLGTLITV